ncbi:MAG: hypothetical protein JOZ53_18540 [Planctomycetaceae bacterium]|nr:hypothetical protein [Planctomycetaceae bacterium]
MGGYASETRDSSPLFGNRPLWKFLRKKALNRWHKTFEAMQEAVAEVLDHLERYRSELDSLMSEEFHILKDADLPLDPAA